MYIVLALHYNTFVIKLIAFLGNPGQEYKNTRHNAGFMLFDHMFGNEVMQSKFHSLFLQKDGIKMLKPLTYMNLSGTAVSEAASFFKLKPEEILVCHDDLELPLGKILLQQGGGLQGHKGLKSISERLGSKDFHRLRLGIGRPMHNDVRLYVTTAFTRDELIEMSKAFSEAERLLKHIQ